MPPRTGRDFPCPNCGKPVYRAACYIGTTKRRYCDMACMRAKKLTSADPVESFWLKVDKRGDDECWGWKSQKRWDGYGRFVNKCRPIWAHRFSYELHHGPIPKGMHVLHSCDNPECSNPKHLRVGTHKENMADCKARGRINRGGSKKQSPASAA
jgi:hypothetical protein